MTHPPTRRACLACGALLVLIAPACGARARETRSSPAGAEPGASGTIIELEGEELRAAVQVSAGDGRSCAVLRSGAVACWGWQGAPYGILDDVFQKVLPTRWGFAFVSDLHDAVRVDVQGDTSCAIRRNGSVRCWGRGRSRGGERVTAPGPFKSFRTGCGLLGDGSVGCFWYSDCRGRSGVGPFLTDPCVVTYRRIETLGRFQDLDGWDWHTGLGPEVCGTTPAGEVLCWWISYDPPAKPPTPTRVEGLRDAVKIAVGETHKCVVRRDETVVCWGWNHYGQLGDGTVSSWGAGLAPPEQPPSNPVVGLHGATDVTLGWHHSCALLRDGTVWCWGRNRLGCACYMSACPTDPSRVGVPASYFCGPMPECASRDDAFPCGQLGNGTAADSPVPVRVLLDEPAVSVDAGELHTCAVGRSGRVYCWGCNGSGEVTAPSLPLPDSYLRPVAVRVPRGRPAIPRLPYPACAINPWELSAP